MSADLALTSSPTERDAYIPPPFPSTQSTPSQTSSNTVSTLQIVSGFCRSSERFKRDAEAATSEWDATAMAMQSQYGLHVLSNGEREMLISRLPPHYAIHALANCFDRDERSPDFVPWTAAYHSGSGRAAWLLDRSQCLRLGTQALLAMMRTHLVYMTEQECRRARAPYKIPKDLLRKAFWRIDLGRTGYVSLPQFMQVCCLSA